MNLNAAAIVCGHIAMKQHPILRAERGPSLSPEDSGWQFLCCAVVQENEDEARVWTIREVLRLEPGLAPWIDSKVRSVVQRANEDSNWVLLISEEE